MSIVSTSNDVVTSLVACGSVTGTSGVAPIAGGASPKLRGIATANIGRTSAGLYTIQLPADSVVSFTDGIIHIMPIAVASEDPNWHIISWTAAGLITIQLNDVEVATDYDFVFDIWRVGVG